MKFYAKTLIQREQSTRIIARRQRVFLHCAEVTQ